MTLKSFLDGIKTADNSAYTLKSIVTQLVQLLEKTLGESILFNVETNTVEIGSNLYVGGVVEAVDDIVVDGKPVITEPNLTDIEEVEVDLRELTEDVEVDIENLMSGKDVLYIKQTGTSADYSYFIKSIAHSMFIDPALYALIEECGYFENLNDEAGFNINNPVEIRIVKLGNMYFVSKFGEVN